MNIQQACKEQAPEIASLIMEAMNYECCQNFAGPHHSLRDFYLCMVNLVGREDSQYSYLNTEVATDDNGMVVGICVTYDGGDLYSLRQAFIDEAKLRFGMDYSDMDPETQSGELYVDSLCVHAEYRGKGIATALLRSAIHKAAEYHIQAVGLLVDQGNPKAEQLYKKVGFRYVNDTEWGGHPMKHLVYTL
ncbi:GNAT family N-acetyltransferase [Segatella bryantii]|uniref:GNAT family N-acetyltransferase n=1 Tax=Segatella bryantii TaxID=77095 RepID=UPI001ED9C74A|nr:GNAT family N-acetyltransferase [Segatella bryantii]UKK72946.1 GNAT family N-acetyltransferase [Segatella bryantii]